MPETSCSSIHAMCIGNVLGVLLHAEAQLACLQVLLTSTASNNAYSVWAATDSTKCGGWLEASFKPTRYETTTVMITTASAGVEAIDAVQLLGYAH